MENLTPVDQVLRRVFDLSSALVHHGCVTIYTQASCKVWGKLRTAVTQAQHELSLAAPRDNSYLYHPRARALGFWEV
jgi:hypothetical protein